MKALLRSKETLLDIDRAWRRCTEAGLAHDIPITKKKVSAQTFHRERALLGDNAIQGNVIPLLDGISAQFSNRHIFLLVTKRGTVILERGTIPEFHERILGASNAVSERTCGTLAVTECLRSGHPVFFLGSDHYLDCFRPYMESASPITDESGAVLACLALFIEGKQDETDINRSPLANATYQICNLAARLIAERSQNRRKKQHLTSQIALADKRVLGSATLVDKAIVIVDKAGKIIRTDGDARRIFQAICDDDPPVSLQDLMPKNPHLAERVLRGERLLDVKTRLGSADSQQQFLINTHPVAVGNATGTHVSIVLISQPDNAAMSQTLEGDRAQAVSFDDMIGTAPAFLKAKKAAIAMSATMARILLHGDIGTGKETFAKAIHLLHSPGEPFVSYNCAALSYQSPEIELFGRREKKRPWTGLLERAHGGTLFLDNIEDLPLSVQPLFLRVLEDYQVTRIGDTVMRPASFKLIAASKKNIAELVAEGLFREDLYYRIRTREIDLSPLRERKCDIMPLAEHFISEYQEDLKIPPISYAPEIVDILLNHNWPGNIRELRAVVKSACYICKNNYITASDLPDEILYATGQTSHDLRREGISLEESKHLRIVDALQATDNNISQAARALGMGRSTLYRYLSEHKFLQSSS